jgi:hypothetical protein
MFPLGPTFRAFSTNDGMKVPLLLPDGSSSGTEFVADLDASSILSMSASKSS